MGKEWKPRRVTSEDERGGGSSEYMTLDIGEKFLGTALFEADPAVDEPGYYEYMEHWDNGNRKSIPCAGEQCPLCADGDKPKTRAKTLWLVSTNEKGTKLDPPELRIFNFNYSIIKQFTELRGEGDEIKGRTFRIAKLDDRGNYGVIPKTEMMTKTALKETLKDPAVPDFEALVTSQLRKAMEGLAVSRAMEDDDDDEPEDKPESAAAKGGKGKPAAAKSTPAAKKTKKKEWPAEAEDLEVTIDEVDDENSLMVSNDAYDGSVKVWGTVDLDLTDLEDGSTVTLDWYTDDDDDFVATSAVASDGEGEGDDQEPADEGGLPEKIEGEQFVVESVNEGNSTIDVKSDELDLEFKLFFLDTMTVDFADYEEGMKIIVTAEKDTSDDMVATEVPEIVKAAGKKGGKGK